MRGKSTGSQEIWIGLYTLRSRGGIFMKEIKTRHLILWRGTEYEVDAFQMTLDLRILLVFQKRRMIS